ncbi:MAG: hypothetical protein WBA74_24350 [Cyclobacteriaceae bacterium]
MAEEIQNHTQRILDEIVVLTETEMHDYLEADQICLTEEEEIENEGFKPQIVVGAGRYVPLWAWGHELKWRFHRMFDRHKNPEWLKNIVRSLLSDAMGRWGEAAPIALKESKDSYDFEITIHKDKCRENGCTMASAFFPATRQQELKLYPMFFNPEYAITILFRP